MQRALITVAFIAVGQFCGSFANAQQFEFTPSVEGRNIRLVARSELYLVTFRLHVQGAKGSRIFARVIASKGGAETVSHATQIFTPRTDDDRWDIRIPAPKFPSADATYTILLGLHDETALTEFNAMTGFRWRVEQASGRAKVVAGRDGQPFPITLKTKTVSFSAGKLQVNSRVRQVLPTPLRIGIESAGAESDSGFAKRVDQ